ncbi:substrate-binding domain-containing protein [Cohnella sp. AR92]|uniref:sugar ABC transporter substrate-binding protein n=1 Tax=Cohnella sp. AR92 TaxID=648716 RepID=UPI000F8C78E5|nr:substrate-binding domain-containing protein [Cohnella sp. AR92]RUS47916.1 sugar ABC transporter substrate-binding protein [Cohnella sp. AR92]
MARKEIINRAFRLFLPGAAFVLAIALLGGCVGSGRDSPASATPDASSPVGQTASKTFGIIYPIAYTTYETITEQAKAAAESRNVSLIVNAPDEANTEQQIRIMESMIKQEVDGIAISPVDAAALSPVIRKATAAGIPVITFESDAPKSGRTAYIGADNYVTGRQFAITISNLLGNKGMIIVETGMQEMLGLHQRLEGLLDYLDKESSIEVLEVRYNQGSEDRAMADIESMINAHPHFSAMVSLDVVSTSVATLIWKAKGLDRISLSMGNNPTSTEALQNGQLTAVISQNEQDWGRAIVETLLEVSEGQKVPEFTDMGIKEIRKEDVE